MDKNQAARDLEDLEEAFRKIVPDGWRPPELNGTLKKLYEIATGPLSKESERNDAIRNMALLNVHIYTGLALVTAKADMIYKVVTEKSEDKPEEKKDSFQKFGDWIVDKVLPSVVILIVMSVLLLAFGGKVVLPTP